MLFCIEEGKRGGPFADVAQHGRAWTFPSCGRRRLSWNDFPESSLTIWSKDFISTCYLELNSDASLGLFLKGNYRC